jgi:hypothetical protein
MMDRISTLITRADYLRRHIYSSIPFGDRLAAFFVRLGLDTVETLGRALGAEFLIRGVTDMPDPGPRWNPQSRNPSLTLPQNYMREFAAKVYGLLMKKFHDPSLVEDAISMFLLKVTTSEKISAKTMASAQSWALQGLIWQALDIIKKRRKEQAESLDRPTGEHGDGNDVRSLQDTLEDPRALNEVKRELSPRVWKMWMEYLSKHIHEDIPLYIALEMQGYVAAEIIGDPNNGRPGMLPHYQPPPSGFKGYYRHQVGKIPEVSRKFFESLHEELPVAV